MADAASPSQGPAPRLHRIGLAAGGGFVALGALGLAFSVVGGLWWFTFAAAALLPFYGALAACGAVAAAALRARRRAAIGAACAAACAAWIAPVYWPAPNAAPADAAPNLRILSVNLFESNRDADALLAYVRAAQPDMVLTQETAEPWPALLAPLHASYPHHLVVPRYPGGKLSLGVYSRLPLERIAPLADLGMPALAVTVRAGGRAVCVVNVHTAAPWSPGRVVRHRDQMRRLAAYAGADAAPTVFAGDFNSSPWSPGLRAVMRAGGLTSARQGLGLLGSWPSIPGPLRVPIDHVLTTRDIQRSGFEVGPYFGSDHRPVLAELRVAPAAS